MNRLNKKKNKKEIKEKKEKELKKDKKLKKDKTSDTIIFKPSKKNYAEYEDDFKDNKFKKKNKVIVEGEKPKKSFFKKLLFRIIILLLIIIIYKIVSSYLTWIKLSNIVFENSASTVYDSNNNELGTIGNERKYENVSYKEIPKDLRNAYIAIEDQRYYSHGGIDIRRTASAMFNYVFGNRSFGGSTITQQLVKNMTGNDSNTINRKVNEWIKATELEIAFSKEKILEEYFNIIYLGPNIYGVKTGAKYYFDKELNDLTIEECAFLAGINHSPNNYNPFKDTDNKDALNEKIHNRTKTVLNKMKELELISEEDYNEASKRLDNNLNFKKGNIKAKTDGNNSYHIDSIYSELIKDLQEKYDITEDFAKILINQGNLKIYSTENINIQNAIENEFNKNKYIINSKEKPGETSQAAMIIIDQKSGNVLGIVGGLGKKTEARGLNRATQSLRQTGSSGKPLSILVPAIEEDYITAASIFSDEPTIFKDNSGEDYRPVDYSDYRGDISVREAIESSQNIPFVSIISTITPKKSIEYLEKLGITTLTEKDDNLALALGGLSKGISPLEMAGAYSAIANDGVYIEPIFYTKVLTSNDKKLIKNNQKTRRVMSKETAFIIKDLLTEPVKGVSGTARYCNIDNMSVAAKTGTTNDNYDKWLCGFTPYYTAACWYGFDYNETINYNHKNPAGILWANVMNKIHQNLDKKEFKKPNSIRTYTICSDTGMLATTGCAKTYTEYFKSGNYPDKCSKHEGILIDKKDKKDVTDNRTYYVDKDKVINVIDDIKSTFSDITESAENTTVNIVEKIIDNSQNNQNNQINQNTTTEAATEITTNNNTTTNELEKTKEAVAEVKNVINEEKEEVINEIKNEVKDETSEVINTISNVVN